VEEEVSGGLQGDGYESEAVEDSRVVRCAFLCMGWDVYNTENSYGLYRGVTMKEHHFYHGLMYSCTYLENLPCNSVTKHNLLHHTVF
jgi:hypothetical protein